MSGEAPERHTSEADEFAAYVASLAGELSRLAQGHGFSTLAYLLEMTKLEARATSPRIHRRVGRANTIQE